MTTSNDIKRLEHKFERTPYTGCQTKLSKHFDDISLFLDKNEKPMWEYAVLKGIKLHYGMPPQPDDQRKKMEGNKGGVLDETKEFPPQQKMILGIELTYINSSNGQEVKSDHKCNISETKENDHREYTLTEGEFFCKVEFRKIGTYFEYMKFITNKHNFVEIGDASEATRKHIQFVPLNFTQEPFIIQCFNGDMDFMGLRSIGMRQITRQNYIFVHMMGVLRLRHTILKADVQQKENWKKEQIEKIDKNVSLTPQKKEAFKSVVLVCLLPDNHFTNVMMYSA